MTAKRLQIFYAVILAICLYAAYFSPPQEQKPKPKYDPATDLLLITSMMMLLGS